MAEAAVEPASNRRLPTLVLLCCATLFVSGLPLPFGLAALVFVIATIVVAVRVLAAPGAGPRVLAALAIVMAAMLGGLGLLRIAFYSAQFEYQECLQSAITEAGRATCDAQVREDIMTAPLLEFRAR